MKGRDVQRLRDEFGLSAEEIARRVMSAPSTVYRWLAEPDREIKGAAAILLEQVRPDLVGAPVPGLANAGSSAYVHEGRVYRVPEGNDPLAESIRAILKAHGAKQVQEPAKRRKKEG